MNVCKENIQISLDVCSVSSLCAQVVTKDPIYLRNYSDDWTDLVPLADLSLVTHNQIVGFLKLQLICTLDFTVKYREFQVESSVVRIIMG